MMAQALGLKSCKTKRRSDRKLPHPVVRCAIDNVTAFTYHTTCLIPILTEASFCHSSQCVSAVCPVCGWAVAVPIFTTTTDATSVGKWQHDLQSKYDVSTWKHVEVIAKSIDFFNLTTFDLFLNEVFEFAPQIHKFSFHCCKFPSRIELVFLHDGLYDFVQSFHLTNCKNLNDVVIAALRCKNAESYLFQKPRRYQQSNFD